MFKVKRFSVLFYIMYYSPSEMIDGIVEIAFGSLPVFVKLIFGIIGMRSKYWRMFLVVAGSGLTGSLTILGVNIM